MESAIFSVLKLDGFAIDGGERAAVAIEELLDSFEEPLVVVTPAFKGTASVLKGAAEDRASGRGESEAALAFLRAGHLAVAEAMDAPAAALEAASLRIECILRRLAALLRSEGTLDRAELLSSGSRLSATCAALAFAAIGRPAPIVEPRRPGLRAELARFPASVVPELRGLGASTVAEELGARLSRADGQGMKKAALSGGPFWFAQRA